jgi:transaldolase
MELYVDSANIDEIRDAAALGIITGVTTNPSLLAKEDPTVDVRKRILEIHEIVGGHLSVEVISTDTDGMLREADEILDWFPEATIKIPMIPAGLRAVRRLSDQEVPTNVTLIFSAAQALAANNAGATYVSVFIGRLDDVAQDGLAVIEQVREIWDIQNLDSMILAASVRHPIHLIEAARLGADIATCPYKTIIQSLKHPLTDKGLEAFLADYNKMQAEIAALKAKA